MRAFLNNLSFVQGIQEALGQAADNTLVRHAAGHTVQGCSVSTLNNVCLALLLSLFRLGQLCLHSHDQVGGKCIHSSGRGDGERDMDRRGRLKRIEMPALGRKAVRNIVNINGIILAVERNNADHGLSNDVQALRQN